MVERLDQRDLDFWDLLETDDRILLPRVSGDASVVEFDHARVTTNSWKKYPIIGFKEIPEIEVTLIESLDHPPLGVGEASLGPTGAAVANAVARALDLRIRDLPITRASIIAASTGQRIS